jgi:AcrR family transcriptional regulator
MDVPNTQMTQDDTRERLLAAAHSQFAERGVYGASIAQIAGEVGLTKQALLYHFKRKEDLYGAVLKRIAARLLAGMRSGVDASRSPEQQFEAMILGIYHTAIENPLDTRVLMRELLDDQRRETPESEWFLKTFLNELAGVLNSVEALADLSFAQKFSRIYLLVSAIQFFVASSSVLTRFYGAEEWERLTQEYPKQLRAQVHRLLEPGGD